LGQLNACLKSGYISPDKLLLGVDAQHVSTSKTAPLVLTLSFHKRDPSPRWKEIVEPYPGRFTHHLELYATNDIDDEVRNWLWEAWAGAV
jgi:hypothetical protein